MRLGTELRRKLSIDEAGFWGDGFKNPADREAEDINYICLSGELISRLSLVVVSSPAVVAGLPEVSPRRGPVSVCSVFVEARSEVVFVVVTEWSAVESPVSAISPAVFAAFPRAVSAPASSVSPTVVGAWLVAWLTVLRLLLVSTVNRCYPERPGKIETPNKSQSLLVRVVLRLPGHAQTSSQSPRPPALLEPRVLSIDLDVLAVDLQAVCLFEGSWVREVYTRTRSSSRTR